MPGVHGDVDALSPGLSDGSLFAGRAEVSSVEESDDREVLEMPALELRTNALLCCGPLPWGTLAEERAAEGLPALRRSPATPSTMPSSSSGVPNNAAKPLPKRRSLVTFEYLHAQF